MKNLSDLIVKLEYFIVVYHKSDNNLALFRLNGVREYSIRYLFLVFL